LRANLTFHFTKPASWKYYWQSRHYIRRWW